MDDSLYSDPRTYDLMFPDAAHAAHVSFYVDEARRSGGPVLDVACGTGSLLVPIAEAGIEAVGLDLNSEMLSAARVRAAAAGVTVDLHQGDMRDFDLGRRFALVFVAFNSMLHLLTSGDLLTFLGCVRCHLEPDGVFVFDIFNPSVEILARPSDLRFPVAAYEDPVIGPVTVEQTGHYHTDEQVNHATWYFSAPDRTDYRTVQLSFRCIFPQELLLLLQAGRLSVDARYGSLARDDYTSDSPLQICVCGLGEG